MDFIVGEIDYCPTSCECEQNDVKCINKNLSQLDRIAETTRIVSTL